MTGLGKIFNGTIVSFFLGLMHIMLVYIVREHSYFYATNCKHMNGKHLIKFTMSCIQIYKSLSMRSLGLWPLIQTHVELRDMRRIRP